VRLKLKSDNGFKEFILSSRRILPILLLLGIGILLVFMGQGEVAKKTETVGEEARLAEMCSAAVGVGDCRVMISYGEDGEVYAVAVLCDGADSIEVERDVKRLVGSLYGIGDNRITVLRLEK